jgi:dihydroflavonol-4-reductase
MKVFVTGGTGFLGKAVVEACLAAGHQVDAMVRAAKSKLPEGAKPIQVAFEEGGRLREALSGADAVIHLAGKVSRDPAESAAMHRIHVEATQKLLDAMKDAGVRKMILASTSGTIAVREKAGRPATEEDDAAIEVVGKWPYYMSKRLQEQEVLRRSSRGEVDAIVLNPSLLLGPGDERLSSTTDVLNILNGRLPALTEGTAAIVDVRDCAPVFVNALTKGRAGQRYLLNGANMKVRTFVERVANAGDVAIPKLVLPTKWALTGAKVVEGLFHAIRRPPPIDVASVEIGCHHWDCDASLAKAELGFSPRDPQKTIQDTVAYLEKRGLFRRT